MNSNSPPKFDMPAPLAQSPTASALQNAASPGVGFPSTDAATATVTGNLSMPVASSGAPIPATPVYTPAIATGATTSLPTTDVIPQANTTVTDNDTTNTIRQLTMGSALTPAQAVLPVKNSAVPEIGAGANTTTEVADRIVLEYLRKRGFKSAEQAFLRQNWNITNPSQIEASKLGLDDAQVDDDLRNVLMLLRDPAQLADADVCRFEDAYCELRDWVDASLDIYKPQLRAVLYPLLIHCFLEMVRRDRWKDARSFLQKCAPDLTNTPADESAVRRSELQSLSSIASPQHVEENETARLYLLYRYEIFLSHYAFELLVSYLADDMRRAVLLRILNQRCRIRVDAPVDGSTFAAGGLFREDANGRRHAVGLVTEEEKPLTEIIWGRLRPEMYTISDEEAVSKIRAKANSDKKGGDKSKTESVKKDSGIGEEEEEASVQEDGTISRSRIPLKRYRVGAPGLETIADRKARARLRVADSVNGIRKDLAILFYTFTNTKNDGLNCSAVTEDGASIAAGFSDSTVRVWDARATGTAGSDAGGLEGKAIRLIGHSGPVYGVDWSKCGKFLLSAAEDGHVRLWNATMKTDLVAYRGHNFPVWDVRFSPLDHYFATASHDRTARIWSTERIYPLRILAGHFADVDAVQWHPNINYLATASSDRTVRLWDIRDGTCTRIFHSSAPVHALAFAPDGRTLASAGDSAVIDIWDLVKGTRRRSLNGHRSTVWSLDYSRDGAVLASAGADWRVCTWRAEEWSNVVQIDDAVVANTCNGTNGNRANGNGASNNGAPDVGSGDASGTVLKNTNASQQATSDSVPASDGNDVDADGDIKMDGRNADVAREPDEVENKSDTKLKDDPSRIDDGDQWNGVPQVEAFDTKETPVQLVKFTRRNLLIAAGSFGT